MDFESLAARKSALGTASIIVMDDTADMVKVAHRLMQFYQNESCGKCTPCREGTRWVVQILSRMESGQGTQSDLKTIQDVCKEMEEHSFCPLAVGAAPPIVSALKEFPNEFEASIRRNPQWRTLPQMKLSYPYM
jgi:NADH-quinone oxidoreductase subunit F